MSFFLAKRAEFGSEREEAIGGSGQKLQTNIMGVMTSRRLRRTHGRSTSGLRVSRKKLIWNRET